MLGGIAMSSSLTHQSLVFLAVCLCVGLPLVNGLAPATNDDGNSVGISFVDCDGSSVLTALPINQPNLTLYASIPEVRLNYPEEAVRDIVENYNGDHLTFFEDNNLVLEDRPLYAATLVRGETRNFSHVFKYEEEGALPRCGGCIFHALADEAPFGTSCPSNITIDVPSVCVLTAFHVDWIEPRDVVMTSRGVSRTTMKNVVREGAAPGDAFVPGAHLISYSPDEDSDFEPCNFTVRVNAFCEGSASVRTIIGLMSFNKTLVGDTASANGLYCPDFFVSEGSSSLPRATAYCIYDYVRGPIWQEPAELTDCLQGKTADDRFDLINMLLMRLIEMRMNGETLDMNEVVEVGLAIDSFTRLDEEDVEDFAEFDRRIAELLGNLILLNDSSKEVTNIVLSIVNNFFSMEENERGGSGNRLTQSLENQAMNQIASGVNYTGVEENVALINVVLNGSDNEMVTLSFGNFKIDPNDPDDVVLQELDETAVRVTGERIDSPMGNVLTSVSLPTNIQSFTSGGRLAVSFLLYRNGSLFQTSGRPVGDLGPRDRQIVGGQVVAATVYNLSNMTQTFSQNDRLVTTFTPVESQIIEEDEELLPIRSCVFWNITNGGFWSTEGCSLDTNRSSNSRIVCQCDHATSFAILVNVRRQTAVFTWISQLGSAISAFALLVTILSVLSVEKLRRRTPWQVHLSLMFALLGLYVVFLFGAEETRYRYLCIGISAAMHYFLLSAFMWMLMEGVLLYLTIVNANSIATLSNFTVKASLAAWGLPVIPVVVPVILRYSLSETVEIGHFYELDSYCFIKPDSTMMYAGLMAIMAVILAVNLVFMVLVLLRLKDLRAGGENHNRKVFVAFISITVLFGITWIIGFFAIRDAQYVVSIVFSVLNGLQGFFIFLLFGVGEKEVRQFWGSTFSCGKRQKKAGSDELKDTSDNSKKRMLDKSGGTGTDSVSDNSKSNPAYSHSGTNEA